MIEQDNETTDYGGAGERKEESDEAEVKQWTALENIFFENVKVEEEADDENASKTVGVLVGSVGAD